MKDIKKQTENYNDAVDLFFGMNPQNPYWILLVFYLAKERKLRRIEDQPVKDETIMVSMDRSYAEITFSDESIQKYWIEKGVYEKLLVADLDINSDFFKIKDAFQQQVYSVKEIKPRSILDRKQMVQHFLFSVAECFMDLSPEWYSENYTSSFDQLVSRIYYKRGVESMMQPKELTRLVCGLLDYKGGVIYNPFSGLSSYGIELNAGNNYHGQEFEKLTWALAKLRMMVYGADSINLLNEDSLSWKFNSVEYVISTPPIGLLLDQNPGAKTKVEAYYLENASFSASVRSVGVYPAGILSSMSENKIRKVLIDKDLFETIVVLPSDILHPYSGVQLCLILTNKDKRHSGYVKFVDASNYYLKEGRRNVIDKNKILDLCLSEDFHEEVILVSNEGISEENYSLDPKRYNKKNITVPDGFMLIPLSEFGTFYTNRSGVSGYGPVVSVKDLSDNSFNFIKTANDFQQGEYKEFFSCVEKDSLLISKIRNLKPTLFKAENGPVFINPNVLAFKVNENKVSIDYLVNELSQEYVKNQLNLSFSNIPSFAISDLNRIQILVPMHKKNQVDRIEHFQKTRITELGIELDKLKSDRFIEFETNMELRRHAIQQKMNVLYPAIKNVSKYLKKHNSKFVNEEVLNPRTGETLLQYFEKIEMTLENVVTMVDALVDPKTYGEAETIWVESFLENYKENHFSQRYTLEMFLDNVVSEDIMYPYLDDHNNLKEGYINKGDKLSRNAILFCQKDLTQVIDNIVSNAQKWGFVDENNANYSVRFIVNDAELNEKPAVSLRISNNGNPLPIGMKKEKVFLWGEGNNTGLGSWQVKNIVEHFGGKVLLNEYPDDPDGFQVEYELVIPTIDTL